MKVTDKLETAIIRNCVKKRCPLLLALFDIYFEQPIKGIRETLIKNKIRMKMGGELISFKDLLTILQKLIEKFNR